MNKPFPFESASLEGKKIVVFGDSTSADATIGSPSTYPHLIQERYRMGELKNYAIGGTTATYMFHGSNIEKEYTLPDKLFAVDGCRVVKKAIENHEVDDASLAFICFGHNDMFFQVPLDNEPMNDNPLDIENCRSIKASFRYMVKSLRDVNPNIQIVIINCAYSEYDKNADLIYGYRFTYSDYRQAIEEVAKELGVYYYDPWDYFKDYFFDKDHRYYKDYVHPNKEGHAVLFEYLTQVAK